MEYDTEKEVLFWGGGFDCLSNFAAYAIEYEGKHWMTAEHLYQSKKFTDEKIKEEIRNTTSAMGAFTLGRKNESSYRKDWAQVRVSVMEEVVRIKLSQHSDVKEKLLESGTRKIIEASPLDAFWGWGPNKDGRNEMGKIWMKLRDELTNNE